LPVLMPNTKVVEGSPRIRGQGNSYVAAYTLPGAKLSILGTSVFLTRPTIKRTLSHRRDPTAFSIGARTAATLPLSNMARHTCFGCPARRGRTRDVTRTRF
jgi:hypothetical protein